MSGTPWGTTITDSGSRPNASITRPRTYSLGVVTSVARRIDAGMAARR